MGFIIPLLIGLFVIPSPAPSAEELADFARIQKALHESIYVVDEQGAERLTRLISATDDRLVLELGPRTLALTRDEVIRVDRERDPTTDGLLKGLAFGAGMGLIVSGLGGGSSTYVLQSMAVYGSIGYLLDRGSNHRTPLYRAPGPAVTATVRVPF